jgi:hypothetical protein
VSKEFCPFCEYSTLRISDAGTLSWFYAGTVIGNWQTSAPSSPLPTLSRNRSFSSMSSLVTSVCSQSSKLVSTFSRTTSSPAKIGMDKGEGNTGLDDLNDSFEEIRELRQLVRGRSYRSSSPECTYFFRTEIFWRRYSREKLRQRDPAQRSVSSGIFLCATHDIVYPQRSHYFLTHHTSDTQARCDDRHRCQVWSLVLAQTSLYQTDHLLR